MLSACASTSFSFKLLHSNQISTAHCVFSGLRLHTNKLNSFDIFAVKNQSTVELKDGNYAKISPRNRGRDLIFSQGKEEDDNFGPICPGCGIFMQDKDPNFPGYYKKKRVSFEGGELGEGKMELEGFDMGFEGENEIEDDFDSGIEGISGEKDDLEEADWDSDELGEDKMIIQDDFEGFDQGFEGKNEIVDDFGSGIEGIFGEKDDFEEMMENIDDGDELDGFTPAGVGYGNITEEIMEKERRKREEKKVTKAERKRRAREARKAEDEVTVCARCHSLRNYGQVKNQTAENLIPDFDFNRLVTTRLMKPSGNATVVVVMVVDCVDFDGSFPKRAAMSLFKALEGAKHDPKASKRLPKLILVATKVDLLPSQISPTRLDRWVRRRARAAGAPKLSGIYLVSSYKDLGVKNLLSYVKELAGPRGHVWVIGAQNAGKSTLINALGKKVGAKTTKLTEAPVPGTTLGILQIGGILSAKAKLYDTPGLLHPYLMSMRLNRDEKKMVEIRKELKPRTYRVKSGQAVHVGGLLRLDLNQASVTTIYITIWASPSVSLHLGKIENADQFWRNHVGVRLQPPVGKERGSELGEWEEREIKVTGTSWDVNSIDIAVGGLGWISLGLKGEATLTLWMYHGIEISLREPLVLDRAPFLERPGFWLPKAVSDAIGKQTKSESHSTRKPSMDSLSYG